MFRNILRYTTVSYWCYYHISLYITQTGIKEGATIEIIIVICVSEKLIFLGASLALNGIVIFVNLWRTKYHSRVVTVSQHVQIYSVRAFATRHISKGPVSCVGWWLSAQDSFLYNSLMEGHSWFQKGQY